MLLRKGVKNANLVALRDPQFCHFKLAPLRRTWVAPLGRSLTTISQKVGYKRGGNISQSEICNLQEATFLGIGK